MRLAKVFWHSSVKLFKVTVGLDIFDVTTPLAVALHPFEVLVTVTIYVPAAVACMDDVVWLPGFHLYVSGPVHVVEAARQTEEV